jgi:hypothetical protein
MRATEFILTEASGLKAARPNEIYASEDGTEYKFQGWNWQFPSNADAYPTSDEMLQAAAEEAPENTVWINQPTSRSKSFAFAIFKADDGTELAVGGYYSKRSPGNTIFDKDVKSSLGLGKPTSNAAVKAESNLQPGQLGLADNKGRDAESIKAVLGQKDSGAMLTQAIDYATGSQPIVFEGGAQIVSALQDDFCEVLAPIAMIAGHPQVTGHLDQAIADVFKGADISTGSTISFPVDQNNPLVDSYIINKGITLGVSHKGKTGAKASITNIWKAKEEAAETATGQRYIEMFSDAVEILDICKESSAKYQPIELGIKFGLASEAEGKALLDMLSNPLDPNQQLKGAGGTVSVIPANNAPESDLVKVPETLRRLFNLYGYRPGSYVGLLCLANLAKVVANHINTDSKINFGEAIRSFLNSSAMVQATSNVSATKDGNAIVKSIGIVYPPNFQEKASIEANGYYGTDIKSKFSFKLPKT